MMVMIIAAAMAQGCVTPPPLRVWSETGSVRATGGVGHPVTLTLTTAPRYATAPGKPPQPGTQGAVMDVTISRAATYRIALGAPAWLDVVRAGKAVASSAHAHGEPCTGIAKMVDFTLSPGRYTLQISGAQAPTIKVLIARLP